MENEQKKPKTWLMQTLIICCLLSIVVSFYFFYYKKDFDFIVEVTCDKTKETCFERDCSNPDDCPPNGLSDFKRYSLKASDFDKCKNEDCASVCASGEIKCTAVKCEPDTETGESCVSPEIPENSQ